MYHNRVQSLAVRWEVYPLLGLLLGAHFKFVVTWD